ncbi:MAG TPA: SDR family NAD(P)-dependent oxidoreductase [Chthonomonadaceae bacterium]|nr:SDR family NAD(P)-dependent oxidoreductase [Chthonomonadaceae bacterium]
MELRDKVCLVTGGTRGIGAATAVELARRGAHVAVCGRSPDAEAEEVVRQAEAAGRRCLLMAADMAKPEDARRCVGQTVEAFDRLDVLVHAAGGPAKGTLLEVDESIWYHAFDVHVHAVFHLCRAAVPHIKCQGEGAIVLVGSTAGRLGVIGAAAYATVKGALVQLTRCLGRELANDNIRVNCVAPGVITTRFHDIMGLTPEARKNNLDNRIPLHREGTPEQVAQVIALLAENDYMTGETITIDGGLTSRIA